MAVDLGDILDSVRRNLRILDDFSHAKAVGDGESVKYRLPDYPVVDAETLVCEKEATAGQEDYAVVSSNDYTVDEDNGFFTFDTAPALDIGIRWTWKWRTFEDDDLIELVNAGVRYLAPDITPLETVDDTLTTTSDEREYAVTGAERVTRVELRLEDTDPWLTVHDWRSIRTATGITVHFTADVNECEMRVTYLTLPTAFSLIDIPEDPGPPIVPAVLVLDQLLTSTSLSETAYDPLVAFVVWQLMTRIWRRRGINDLAQNQKEESEVTMRDLQALENHSRVLFELNLARFSSDMPHGRLVQ